MRILRKEFRLQDVTVMYFTALAALMVILVASYQAPAHITTVELAHPDSESSEPSPPDLPMPFRVLLDPLGKLQLAWNISYSRQEVYMELKVADLKHGVVLGMSERGELTDADLVLLWDSHRSSSTSLASTWVFNAS